MPVSKGVGWGWIGAVVVGVVPSRKYFLQAFASAPPLCEISLVGKQKKKKLFSEFGDKQNGFGQ